MKPNFKRVIGVVSLTLFCLSSSVLSFSQEQTTAQQLWLEFIPSKRLSERVILDSKVGVKAINTHNWTRYYVSPRIFLRLKRTMLKFWTYSDKLYAGVDIYYNNNSSGGNIIEIAPYQGYFLSLPKRERYAITHKLEITQRFQFDLENQSSSWGIQTSYEAAFLYKFKGDLVEFGKGMFATLRVKLYWNMVESGLFNDVIKIRPGLGYSFSDHWKGTVFIGYNYIKNLESDQNFYINNVILQLRAYYQIF